MRSENPQPRPADLERIVQGLANMRDALLAVALALRDYQLTLDSPERHAAELQARQMIERVMADENRTNSGSGSSMRITKRS